jgi:hypothetical protein
VVSTRFALARKLPARTIEIVRVLIMAEQHRVDLADCLRSDGGTCELLQPHMRQLIGARRIEGRIGEQRVTVDFDQSGRAADQGDGQCHDLLL